MSSDTKMEDVSASSPQAKVQKSHQLLTCTIKAPPFSYAHLEIVADAPLSTPLDMLQVRSYCTAALRQFLGATGIAIAIDILKVEGNSCWLRVPRQDLGSFAAAITAWPGISEQGVHCMLRVRQCSDWLGTMVGRVGQDELWTS